VAKTELMPNLLWFGFGSVASQQAEESYAVFETER